ncbi:MAG: hypothetical protein ACYDCO_27705 [Armatimonadota bacterium]
MSSTQSVSPDLLVRGEYKKILEFYPRIKRLVCLCEKVDPEQRANLSPIAELRSALDHIMRAHSRLYGITVQFDDEPGESVTEEDTDRYEYCRKHLDKARGHLYRAGYDAYDVISMALLDDIYAMEQSVSKQAFFTVIKEGPELLKKADEAKEWFTSAKAGRDVESSSAEQGVQFAEYEKANTQLAEIRDTIRGYMRLLTEYDREKTRRDRRESLKFLLQVAGILVAVFGLIVAIIKLFLP